jgi:hypothetical protein
VTAPALVRPHAAAVVVMLTAGGCPAYDSEGPIPTARPGSGWVVLWADPGTPEGTLGDRHRDLLLEFQATAVGCTPEQCRWAVDKARTILLGTIPAIAGRAVEPLWQVGQPPPIQRDDDEQPPLFYQPVSYRLRSVPA